MLIDQLLINPHIEESIKKELQKSIAIDATNVSDYTSSLEHNFMYSTHFPNIAPPFQTFFLEYRAPSYCWHFEKWPENAPVCWGLLCTSKQMNNGWHLTFHSFAKFKLNRLQSYLGPFEKYEINAQSNGEPEIVEDSPFFNNSWGKGYLLEFQIGNLDICKKLLWANGLSEPGGFFDSLLAISFMHCKNVVLRQQVPPAVKPTPKQQRQRIQPYQPVTYHVLDIEPMKQILKTEGKIEQVGLQRALHICRGHFSTYTEEKKLFGKYAGTFWVPQHVRGSAESGIATKDYRIKLEK